MSLQAEF